MSEAELVNHLKPLLDRIHALLQESDRIEERGTSYRTKPYPPATEAQIAAREKALDFKFPPTYRAFLKIHNGWRGFPIDFAMFGVSGAGYLRPAKELASYLKVFERTFRRQGRTHVEDLKRKEKSDPDVIYMPHHPSIATDFNGVFTVFDRNRPLAESEYEIADVSSGQFVERRFHGFQKLLDDVYAHARARVIEIGADPDLVEKRKTTDAAPRSTARQPAKRKTPGKHPARKSS